MADYLQFTRRFKELITRESQGDVAAKLGYTQSRISQVARGEKPSREFVYRLTDAYGLDLQEWLGYAGLQLPGLAAEEEVADRREFARLVAEETAKQLRQAPAELAYEPDADLPARLHANDGGDFSDHDLGLFREFLAWQRERDRLRQRG